MSEILFAQTMMCSADDDSISGDLSEIKYLLFVSCRSHASCVILFIAGKLWELQDGSF